MTCCISTGVLLLLTVGSGGRETAVGEALFCTVVRLDSLMHTVTNLSLGEISQTNPFSTGMHFHTYSAYYLLI